MKEHYELENIEQLRALADMLRIRIIDLLIDRPMTVTQLGESLGLAPAKVHYHVRELEKAGLLRLVETREKGGILEKYYQPVARNFSVEKVLHSLAPDEATTTMGGWLNQVHDGFLRAYRLAFEEQDVQQQKERLRRLRSSFATLYLTADEQQALLEQINALCKPYEKRRGIEGEEDMLATLLIYPQNAMVPVRETAVTEGKAWAVGGASFSREDLERAVATAKPLRINVVGICRFADDVSPELADRAVEHLHVVGTLYASPAVREVLHRKQQ